MTCEDCYHYEACKEKFAGLKKICVKNPVKHLELNPRAEIVCQQFKDKSLIVELPCEIGTELFLSDNIMQHHRLKEYKFIGTRVVMVIECFEFQRTCKRFLDEHFGITVFLTKEEAEEKLKELNQIANQKLHDKD